MRTVLEVRVCCPRTRFLPEQVQDPLEPAGSEKLILGNKVKQIDIISVKIRLFDVNKD